MKFTLTLLVMIIGLMSSPCLAEEILDLGSKKAMINYSVGYQIGDDFKRQGVELNPEVLVKGIQDALSKSTPLMNAEEQRTRLVNLQRQVAAKQDKEKAKPDPGFLRTAP